MPLLGHFGTLDTVFPIASVDLLEAKLRGAGVPFEFHRYVAQHAFANETQVGAAKQSFTGYDADAAALAWSRTLAFFGKHLR